MKTKTIGQVLQDERQNHNVSIEELSQRTRIRPEYLVALEENRFHDLPSAVFVKGYMKTYAQVFGFDHEPLLALLRRDFKESAVGKLVPREFIKPVLRKRRVGTPVTLVLLAFSSVFLTLLIYLAVQWYNFQKPPLLTIAEPKTDQVVSSEVLVRGQTIPDGIVSVNDQPIGIQQDGSFKTQVSFAQEGFHVVTVEVSDRRGKKNVVQRMVHVQF
jgi:cytoskeletal protein RodZ